MSISDPEHGNYFSLGSIKQILPSWDLQKTFPKCAAGNTTVNGSSSIPLMCKERAISWWCFCFLGQLNEYLLVILITNVKNVSFLSNGYKLQNQFSPQLTSDYMIHRNHLWNQWGRFWVGFESGALYCKIEVVFLDWVLFWRNKVLEMNCKERSEE